MTVGLRQYFIELTVIDEVQLETGLKDIAIARKENGEPLCGGNRLSGSAYDKGYLVEPTVFAHVKEGDTLAKEEVFGPVLAIMKLQPGVGFHLFLERYIL
ncbi:MAG: aldehyde dehydrogenase family protein [Acidobacteriota bacterium]